MTHLHTKDSILKNNSKLGLKGGTFFLDYVNSGKTKNKNPGKKINKYIYIKWIKIKSFSSKSNPKNIYQHDLPKNWF